MQIELLADHPEFIRTVAEWHHAEWAYLRPGVPLEARISRLKAECGRREPPVTFIAYAGGQLLASAMLLPHDMDTRPQWSPWLAGVFTAPEFRGRGIATKLTRHVVQHAAETGFKRLYLYTPNADQFYARRGWMVLERTSYRGADVTVMTLESI